MTSPEIPSPPPHHGSGHTEGRPAAERRPAAGQGTAAGTALAVLVAVVVTAVACLTTVYLSSQSARAAVAWGSGAAGAVLCVAVAVAAHGVLTGRQLRAQLAAQQAEAAQREAAAAHFADSVVPSVVERLRAGGSAETALAEAPPVHSPAERRVLITLATEVHKGESMRASALSACANAAGRVQALATSMAADLREMEHKHADENVLGDLLHLDHRTAQAGRLADSIAVLTGARSGRRWAKPIVMESILRGAMGRIGGYQRVRLHSTSGVAVAGHAAEGVMHTLAELMDNAANFSPPTSEVHVYVEEVAAGIVITIEDGGLVMGEVALRRAERLVSPDAADPGLATLSGTRLGLAVVGRLARKHGLSVSFRPSAHGGTGVLVRVPRELVTETQREEPLGEPSAAAPRTEERVTVPGTAHERGEAEHPAGSEHAPTPAHGVQYGESGLPKRRRGQTLAAVARTEAGPGRTASATAASTASGASAAGPGTEGGTRQARPSGARFGDFRRAVQGGSPPEDGGGTAENDSGTPENVTTPSAASPASSPARASSLPEDDTE
ncbi:sensor histidine kinase [Streptomyces iconiensis]|uniref:histidine kinase n=1 Tax=Streptomyces iconiensis TaxID=1384038 RepID=A0ABT6ZPV7_9ACTN|nr:ATP-binding protein [Streptomyces iconiensis]MDJ1131069.1 ATP-binding protein [Streptomyces iconiensis]